MSGELHVSLPLAPAAKAAASAAAVDAGPVACGADARATISEPTCPVATTAVAVACKNTLGAAAEEGACVGPCVAKIAAVPAFGVTIVVACAGAVSRPSACVAASAGGCASLPAAASVLLIVPAGASPDWGGQGRDEAAGRWRPL